jgi:hypothetical protein
MTVSELIHHLEIVQKKLDRLAADGDDANPMAIEHWENVKMKLVSELTRIERQRFMEAII